MIVTTGSRPFSLPSKQYKAWHEEQSWMLRSSRGLLIEKGEMTLMFFAPDARVSDLSNKTESVMDLLVDNEVITDDNWFVIGDLHLKFGGIDRENPRVEIIINH